MERCCWSPPRVASTPRATMQATISRCEIHGSHRKAVADWSRVTALLAAHPRGDNYDFTGTSRLLGVVCAPDRGVGAAGSGDVGRRAGFTRGFKPPGTREMAGGAKLAVMIH